MRMRTELSASDVMEVKSTKKDFHAEDAMEQAFLIANSIVI